MNRRKNRQNEIEISLEDVELIMGKNFQKLHIFLESAFCIECSGQTAVVDYVIYLDDVNDLIFEGYCLKCKAPVSRYIETGGSPSAAEFAGHIREVKTKYKLI